MGIDASARMSGCFCSVFSCSCRNEQGTLDRSHYPVGRADFVDAATEVTIKLLTAIIAFITAVFAAYNGFRARKAATNADAAVKAARQEIRALSEYVTIEQACTICTAMQEHYRNRHFEAAATASMRLLDIVSRIPELEIRQLEAENGGLTLQVAMHELCDHLERSAQTGKCDVAARKRATGVIVKLRRILSVAAGERQRDLKENP